MCIDACKGVTCDPDQVCDLGICKTKCQCGICEAGKTCAAAGKCVDTGCDGTTCGAGTVCKAGTCVDACQGAVCPAGSACTAGACVPLPGSGGSGTGGSGITIGKGGTSGLGGDGNGGATGGSAGKGGKGGKGGSKSNADKKVAEDPDSGCGCRVAGEPATSLALPLGAFATVLGLGLARRRRLGGATKRA